MKQQQAPKHVEHKPMTRADEVLIQLGRERVATIFKEEKNDKDLMDRLVCIRNGLKATNYKEDLEAFTHLVDHLPKFKDIIFNNTDASKVFLVERTEEAPVVVELGNRKKPKVAIHKPKKEA